MIRAALHASGRRRACLAVDLSLGLRHRPGSPAGLIRSLSAVRRDPSQMCRLGGPIQAVPPLDHPAPRRTGRMVMLADTFDTVIGGGHAHGHAHRLPARPARPGGRGAQHQIDDRGVQSAPPVVPVWVGPAAWHQVPVPAQQRGRSDEERRGPRPVHGGRLSACPERTGAVSGGCPRVLVRRYAT